MRTGSQRTTIAIVLAVTALVILPVLVRGFPREVARWHLAAALNAISSNDNAGAQRSLQQAIEWNPNVSGEADYRFVRERVRVNEAAKESPKRHLEALKAAILEFPRLRRLGIRTADQYAKKGDFKSALEFTKLAFGDEPLTEADELNQMAYFRALAGEELDQALEEINRALELASKPPLIVDKPSLLDTRAWVLFQMGRLTEALADADSAVKAKDASFKAWPPSKGKSLPGIPSATQGSQTGVQKGAHNASGENPATNETLLHTSQSVGSELWGLGVMRYHRAKILESLGRESEAAADYQWLKDRNLPQDDRLY